MGNANNRIPVEELIGQRFEHWVVLSEGSPSHHRNLLCQCDCGKVKEVDMSALRSGASGSCGCKRKGNFKHGGVGTPEYSVWNGMITRCTKSYASSWDRYGERGITVCERWMKSFPAFLEDMGPRPSSDHQIERLDNSRGYEPENCIWIHKSQQAKNRRSVVWLTHLEKTQTVADWARELGINAATIRFRLKKGWLPELALTVPVTRGGIYKRYGAKHRGG